ncbi:Sorting nexin, cytoplasm-to-vacuole targeting pathway/endosomal sorting [Entophlyctis sp. JEL0112]|nr:Sorting nexin, cytoplasm-to-vacuole targeting pathway/endosomal sorting [Entophlyctis sp. JEL0112]
MEDVDADSLPLALDPLGASFALLPPERDAPSPVEVPVRDASNPLNDDYDDAGNEPVSRQQKTALLFAEPFGRLPQELSDYSEHSEPEHPSDIVEQQTAQEKQDPQEQQEQHEQLQQLQQEHQEQQDQTQQQLHNPQLHNPHIPRKNAPCCNIDAVLAASPTSYFLPVLSTANVLSPEPAICVPEALKVGDHIEFVIRASLHNCNILIDTRHRYSEFESFQRLLRRMHPTILVPPVPEKQSVADYAVAKNPISLPGTGHGGFGISGKSSRDDSKLVETRRRQLQTFLNRVAAHPILGREHAFHGFLDPRGRSFSDMLQDCGVAHYLKIKDAKKQTANAVGLRISDALLKNPDSHFLAAEEYTYKFGHQLSHLLKHKKRMLKHLGDSAHTGTELGGLYNSWSLIAAPPPHAQNSADESDLPRFIESVGEAIDRTVTSQFKLLRSWEERVWEPLSGYEKLTAAIEGTLRWRHLMHVEYETSSEALVASRALVAKLEGAESEADRIARELVGASDYASGQYSQQQSHNRGLYSSIVAGDGTTAQTAATGSAVNESDDTNERESGGGDADDDESDDPYAATRRALSDFGKDRTRYIGNSHVTSIPKPTFPPQSASTLLSSINTLIATTATAASTAAVSAGTTVAASFPGLSAAAGGSGVGGSIGGSAAVGGESAADRRATLQRAREKTRTLEVQRVERLARLGAANDAIQRDLDRFQRDKVVDLRNALLACAVAGRDHAQRSLDAWRDAVAAMDGIGGSHAAVVGAHSG